ncbi:MAG: hypothetical protein QOG62_2147 [Thermoleophilaceae bacterium]|nr:hypothetical protein [Thermoleophilaceae bacterium]
MVDGPSILYRAFFALPSSIRGTDDRPVNALLGSANLVLKEIEIHSPRAVVVCFGAEAAHYRKDLLPVYHADRPPVPDELEAQWADTPAFYGAFGWTVVDHESLEADDLLGSFALREAQAGGSALLFTGDRDMFQCVTDNVTVLYPRGGGDGAEVVTPDGVRERYGIGPELVPDFIALRGDPSDGIPGAKGIGQKTAAELLGRHGSLESLIENAESESRPRVRAVLADSSKDLLEYKDIATLRETPVDLPPDTPTDWSRAAAAARERGMNRLADRLEKAAA